MPSVDGLGMPDGTGTSEARAARSGVLIDALSEVAAQAVRVD